MVKTQIGLERTQRERNELTEFEVETALEWAAPPTEADALSWAVLVLRTSRQHVGVEQDFGGERVLRAVWVPVLSGDAMEYVLMFLSMGEDGCLHVNLCMAL